MYRILAVSLLFTITSCVWADGPHARVEVLVGLAESSMRTDLDYTVDVDVAWLAVDTLELRAMADGEAGGAHHHAEQPATELASEAVGWIPTAATIDLMADEPWLGAAAVPEGELSDIAIQLGPSADGNLLHGSVAVIHAVVSSADEPPIVLWVRTASSVLLDGLPIHLDTINGVTTELHLLVDLSGAFDGIPFAELADDEGLIVSGPGTDPEISNGLHRALVRPTAWSQLEHGDAHE